MAKNEMQRSEETRYITRRAFMTEGAVITVGAVMATIAGVDGISYANKIASRKRQYENSNPPPYTSAETSSARDTLIHARQDIYNDVKDTEHPKHLDYVRELAGTEDVAKAEIIVDANDQYASVENKSIGPQRSTFRKMLNIGFGLVGAAAAVDGAVFAGWGISLKRKLTRAPKQVSQNA